jgi:hypothetical protein
VDVRAATGNPADPGLDGIPDLIVTNGQAGTVSVLAGRGNGFFNDVNPPTLSLGAPVLPGAVGGLAVTTDGRVLGYDVNRLSAGAVTLYAPPPGEAVNAVQALALPGSLFPVLFVASRDGAVEALTSRDGRQYTEAARVADASLQTPSALAVLTGGSGLLEIYVTDAAKDAPVVLRFDVSDILATPASTGEGGTTFFSEGGAPLVLVAVLLTTPEKSPTSPGPGDEVSDGTLALALGTLGHNFAAGLAAPDVAPGPNGEPVLVPLGERLLAGVRAVLSGTAEEDEDRAADQESAGDGGPSSALPRFVGGVDQALEQFRRPPEARQDEDRGAAPDLPTPGEPDTLDGGPTAPEDRPAAQPVPASGEVEVPPTETRRPNASATDPAQDARAGAVMPTEEELRVAVFAAEGQAQDEQSEEARDPVALAAPEVAGEVDRALVLAVLGAGGLIASGGHRPSRRSDVSLPVKPPGRLGSFPS